MPESWTEMRRLSAGRTEPRRDSSLVGRDCRNRRLLRGAERRAAARAAVLRSRGAANPGRVGQHSHVAGLSASVRRHVGAAAGIEDHRVRLLGQPPGARKSLDKAELKQMHADLTSDLSSTHGSFEAQVVSRQFHLGQPVDLGPAGSVLRVALGGELITRVATDSSLGEIARRTPGVAARTALSACGKKSNVWRCTTAPTPACRPRA